jgi:hypothetical protein
VQPQGFDKSRWEKFWRVNGSNYSEGCPPNKKFGGLFADYLTADRQNGRSLGLAVKKQIVRSCPV